MSRIGKLPIAIPKGVDVKYANGVVAVKGPNGELSLNAHPDMIIVVDEAEIRVERPSEQQNHRALHGLTRSLVANMVEGVTKGFTKSLEIVGVGYKAEHKGTHITLTVGFSHTIDYAARPGVKIECPSPTSVVISGPDKANVGQAAAEIRNFRPPEPYKGKGIRYKGEQVRRKAGKTAGA